MSARRHVAWLAVSLSAVLAAGCAPARSSDARRHRLAAAWSARVDWPFSLGVDGGDAVVTAGRHGVIDFDTSRGRERWRTDVADVTSYDPAFDADTVVISAGDRFIALERSSGGPRWEAPVGEHAGGVALTRAGSDAIALVTTEEGMVAALDAATGHTRWSVRVPGDIFAAPAVDARAGIAAVVWSGDADRLGILELATGAFRWESATEAGNSAPVVHDGAVVLGEGSGNFEARIVSRDLASGAERWSVPAPASFESGLTPGADGSDVAMADHFGTVTLVDAGAGKARWQTAIREPILDTRVLLTPRSVVLTTYGGQVVVLDRGSGRVVRRVDAGGFPVGIGASRGRLIFAVRLAHPDRVEALALR